MVIDYTGNVGIGYTSPINNLEVNVSVYINGHAGIKGDLSLFSSPWGFGVNLNCGYVTCISNVIDNSGVTSYIFHILLDIIRVG